MCCESHAIATPVVPNSLLPLDLLASRSGSHSTGLLCVLLAGFREPERVLCYFPLRGRFSSECLSGVHCVNLHWHYVRTASFAVLTTAARLRRRCQRGCYVILARHLLTCSNTYLLPVVALLGMILFSFNKFIISLCHSLWTLTLF
jgi:hypothetical protein